MAFLRAVVRSLLLVGLSAAWLGAQSSHARVIVAPQGRPRIASIAPPPPPPRLFTYGQTVFGNYPVIVTPDGRVLVDLGNGYEQVARTCPYAYGYACLSYGYPIAPQTTVPQYIAPRYAPPAYGAGPYPTPTYPPAGGYGAYGYAPPGGGYGTYGAYGYIPSGSAYGTYGAYGYTPPGRAPAPAYGGCPSGYVPTGSYPPCVDPSRTPATSAPMPAAGAMRAAPRRPVGRSTSAPRIVPR
jgi:hypothetical protein